MGWKIRKTIMSEEAQYEYYENNRHVFGIRLYIGGHFEKIRCPVYGGSTKALNYVGGTICHIDDVEAFEFDLKDLDEFALRFGYEVGSLMYYGHNCYDYDPHHTVYPLLNAENLQEFMERTSPYEPLFDIFVINNPSNEFLSFINPRNIPLRKLSCDQSGRRATECIKVGTHCGTPLLLRDVAFDPQMEERRQREEEGEICCSSNKKARK